MDETLDLNNLDFEENSPNFEMEDELANSGSFNFDENDDVFFQGIQKVEEESPTNLEFIQDVKITE